MRIPVTIAIALWAWTAPLPANDLTTIPIREVTVFKDGHAFILHEGKMPTDGQGDVLVDNLPEPVLGTFWPYSADPSASLAGVVAGQRTLSTRHMAGTLRKLLELNEGKQAIVSENGGVSYQARVLSVLDDIILFATDDGTRAVDLSRVRDVTFLEEPETSYSSDVLRNRLQLDLDWKSGSPAATAQVGMVYLQKGIRWIPQYKVELKEGGKALIRLQATLLNEIIDLQDVTTHLVIGVPSFAFKNELDPIALQDTAAQLSRHFRSDQRTANAFSNAIMSQSMVGPEGSAVDVSDFGEGNDADSAKNEDLFIFTVEHITLKKGERMVVPIAEVELDYQDVFTLDIPFAPPPDVSNNLGESRQAELARRLAKPLVRHMIRLSNDSPYPLTTAPALVVRDGRLLAQGLMTYTAIGGECDLEAGDAVDIQVVKDEKETRRVPEAVRWRGNTYAKVDLEGTVRLTNRRGTPVRLEVTRWLLGNLESADDEAEVTAINLFEDGGYLPSQGGYPFWWGWYGWPSWWRHFNGVSRITWKLELEDQEKAELAYSWHYYWR